MSTASPICLFCHPSAGPTRIISDNGPQFIARDFKLFVRELGLEHVRTSPYYPQSNGKKERFYQTLKGECLRPQTPLTPEAARRVVARFVAFYNEVRLHSAIGYITPRDMLEDRAKEIHAERARKLEELASEAGPSRRSPHDPSSPSRPIPGRGRDQRGGAAVGYPRCEALEGRTLHNFRPSKTPIPAEPGQESSPQPVRSSSSAARQGRSPGGVG